MGPQDLPTREVTHLRTLWKTLARPHQDYASQLWSPVGSPGDLLAQETPLRAFSKRFRGFHGLHYWDRLSSACLLSTERRQERYKIIYAWKALQGLVPDCGIKVATAPGTRRGRTLAVPLLTGTRMAMRTLKEKSFQSEAPHLYNSLPSGIHDLDSSLDTFKLHLDTFLQGIPDQPAIPGSVPGAIDVTGRPSNSVRDWVRKLPDLLK